MRPLQDVQYDSPQNTEQKASHHLQEGMAQHLYAPCSAASHQAKDSLSYLLEDPEAPRADHPAAFQQTSTHAGQEGSSPPGLPPRKPLGSGTRREGRRGLQERGPPGAVWRVRRTSTSSFPSVSLTSPGAHSRLPCTGHICSLDNLLLLYVCFSSLQTLCGCLYSLRMRVLSFCLLCSLSSE